MYFFLLKKNCNNAYTAINHITFNSLCQLLWGTVWVRLQPNPLRGGTTYHHTPEQCRYQGQTTVDQVAGRGGKGCGQRNWPRKGNGFACTHISTLRHTRRRRRQTTLSWKNNAFVRDHRQQWHLSPCPDNAGLQSYSAPQNRSCNIRFSKSRQIPQTQKRIQATCQGALFFEFQLRLRAQRGSLSPQCTQSRIHRKKRLHGRHPSDRRGVSKRRHHLPQRRRLQQGWRIHLGRFDNF